MATSKIIQARIQALYESEGFSQANIHEKINQEYPGSAPSLKTVQNLIERNSWKKNSKIVNKWTKDRKWTYGNDYPRKDWEYIGGQKKEIFTAVLESARENKLRWLEWYLTALYTKEGKDLNTYWENIENPIVQTAVKKSTSFIGRLYDEIPLLGTGFGKGIKDKSDKYWEIIHLFNLIYRNGNTFFIGMKVLDEWLGSKDSYSFNKFIDISTEYRSHLYQVNMGSIPEKEFKKKISPYTRYFKRNINKSRINLSSNGDIKSPDTLDTISGLKALKERLPVFSSIPRRSDYKDMELFQVFLNIFKSEPINN